jgi:hypothetical protein
MEMTLTFFSFAKFKTMVETAELPAVKASQSPG